MNWRDIEAFVAIVETGSVVGAARRLNATQPAVTRRLQRLEEDIGGGALLDRHSKPLMLTPAGHRVLESCHQVLDALRELRATSATGLVRGEIRLGVVPGLMELAVGAPLDAIKEQFPGLHPQVISHWTIWLIERIRNGTLDCAVCRITGDHQIPSGIGSSPMYVEPIFVVAARDLAIAPRRGDLLGISDLARQEWILNTPGCGYRATLQRAFNRSGLPLRISAELMGDDLKLSLIARGAGLGLSTRRQIERSPYRAELRILEPHDFELKVIISMLRSPSLGDLSPAVDLFQAEIADRLQGDAARA